MLKLFKEKRKLTLLTSVSSSGGVSRRLDVKLSDRQSCADVASAVALRDAGQVAEAASLLSAYILDYPDDVQAVVELMLIGLKWRRDVQAVLSLFSTLPEHIRLDLRLALMAIIAEAEIDSYVGVASRLLKLDIEALSTTPFFGRMFLDALIQLVKELDTIVRGVVGNAEGEDGRTAYIETLAATISGPFSHLDDPTLSMAFIRESAFTARILHLFEIMEIVTDRLPDNACVAAKAAAVAFSAAFQADALLRRTNGRWAQDHRLRGSPLAQRFGILWGQEPDISILDPIQEGKDSFRALKLKARVAAAAGTVQRGALPRIATPVVFREINTPQHIFVGLFGQLRFADYIIPNIQKFVTADQKRFLPNSRLSLGLSSWDMEGQRLLQSGENVNFALDRLPEQLVAPIATLGCGTVGELADFLPNTISFLRKSSGRTQRLSERNLRDGCGWKGLAKLECEAELVNSLTGELASRFQSDQYFANQLRMWSRIEGLKELIVSAESQNSTPVDWVVFLRVDLLLGSGSLLQPILHMAANRSKNIATFDYDPMALLIEGLGDRVMICSRQAAECIMSGLDAVKKIFAPEIEVDQRYKDDVQGHTFLGTLMYESGAEIRQLGPDRLEFSIYRGVAPMKEIAEVLSRDVARLPEGVREVVLLQLQQYGESAA